jgi:hypothetical protein
MLVAGAKDVKNSMHVGLCSMIRYSVFLNAPHEMKMEGIGVEEEEEEDEEEDEEEEEEEEGWQGNSPAG